MTSLNKNANIFSILISFFSVVIFVIACIFLKTKEKAVYKTIQIQLSPVSQNEKILPKEETKNLNKNLPLEEKTQEKVEEEIPKFQQNSQTQTQTQTKSSLEQTEQRKTQQSPLQQNQIKTQSSQSQTSSKASQSQERVNQPKIRKSIEELMAEQNAPKESQSSVDWNQDFSQDEISNVQNQSSTVEPKIASTKSSFYGTSGSVSSTNNSASSSSSSKNQNQTQEVSNQTKSSLQDLENVNFSSSSSENSLSENQNNFSTSSSNSSLSSFNSKNANDSDNSEKILLKTVEGRPRQLISPLKPSISLSEKNTSGIETNLHVTIMFTITANGSVPVGQISFSPSSVLSTELQSEIREQISKWIFSQDPNGSSGTASFDYIIQVK